MKTVGSIIRPGAAVASIAASPLSARGAEAKSTAAAVTSIGNLAARSLVTEAGRMSVMVSSLLVMTVLSPSIDVVQ